MFNVTIVNINYKKIHIFINKQRDQYVDGYSLEPVGSTINNTAWIIWQFKKKFTFPVKQKNNYWKQVNIV